MDVQVKTLSKTLVCARFQGQFTVLGFGCSCGISGGEGVNFMSSQNFAKKQVVLLSQWDGSCWYSPISNLICD